MSKVSQNSIFCHNMDLFLIKKEQYSKFKLIMSLKYLLFFKKLGIVLALWDARIKVAILPGFENRDKI